MRHGVRGMAGLVLLTGLTAACGPGPGTDSPSPRAGTEEARASGMCQVDVRNGMDLPVEASYWDGSSTPLGVLQPSQETSFAVPCSEGSVSVGAVAPHGASLDRGNRWTDRRVELIPGEVARVVLGPYGGR